MTTVSPLTREEEQHMLEWYYDVDASSSPIEENYRKSTGNSVLASDMERALAASAYHESGFPMSPPSEKRRN